MPRTVIVLGLVLLGSAGCSGWPPRGAWSAGCSPAVPSPAGRPVKFFGLADQADRVVYVIDTAGMAPQAFAYVQVELVRSIQALAASQRFSVVRFAAGAPEPLTIDGRANLLPANSTAVELARRFVLAPPDTGQGDRDAAWRAVRCALELGGGPQAVFLVSSRPWPNRLAERIRQFNVAPAAGGSRRLIARIHTVAVLHTQSEEPLAMAAAANGGRHRFIQAVDLGSCTD